MKRTVHNERWKAVHDKHIEAWDLVLDDQDEMNFAHRGSFLTLDDPGYDEARARLAAQAPAMARLLLSLEWGADVCIGYDNMTARGCSSCGGLEKQPAPGRADFDGFTVGHAPDCALVAVLKAAGVIRSVTPSRSGAGKVTTAPSTSTARFASTKRETARRQSLAASSGWASRYGTATHAAFAART